jgi:hypothetical protein
MGNLNDTAKINLLSFTVLGILAYLTNPTKSDLDEHLLTKKISQVSTIIKKQEQKNKLPIYTPSLYRNYIFFSIALISPQSCPSLNYIGIFKKYYLINNNFILKFLFI